MYHMSSDDITVPINIPLVRCEYCSKNHGGEVLHWPPKCLTDSEILERLSKTLKKI